jgi:hypothetical protein
MAQCHIQWLYLAVHGCKTYLNLNLNLMADVRRVVRAVPLSECQSESVTTV